jgi:hypothetical protein
MSRWGSRRIHDAARNTFSKLDGLHMRRSVDHLRAPSQCVTECIGNA